MAGKIESWKELIDFARGARDYQGDIITLGGMLPETDGELISLLERLMDELEAEAFSNLWMAAHWVKREIPGRILALGAQFLGTAVIINATAPLCAGFETEEKGNLGETTGALLKAVDSGKLAGEREMVALVNAIRCWKIAHGEDKPLPDKIGFEARRRAREYFSRGLSTESVFANGMLLNVLAFVLDDEHIKSDLKEKGITCDEKIARRYIKNAFEITLAKLLPERKPDRVISGYQVRRAVPKLSRNDSCHCGSGKKYKKCCFAEDQKKLSRSSEVEGITIDELEEEKEERLTPGEVQFMRPYQLMRLDPSRLGEIVLLPIARQLMLYDELDHIFTIYEATPHRESAVWGVVFSDLLFEATGKKRRDLIDRILTINPNLELECETEVQFARTEGDRAALMGIIETECRRILELEEEEKAYSGPAKLNAFGQPARSESVTAWVRLAFNLLESDCPYLGISFARAAIPIAERDSETLLERIEKTRDSLGLDPVDLSEEISQLRDAFDSKKWMEEMEQRVDRRLTQKLIDQAREIEIKERDYRVLKESLAESRKETARIEKQAQEKLAELDKRQVKSEEPADPGHNKEIRELRKRIDQLKSEVKLKHNQRNELRRELRTTRSDLEMQSHASVAPAETWDEDSEEIMLESDSYSPTATPRIPIFPESFIEKKKSIPSHVISSAIKLAGRLAGGEEAAYQGTRRLKSKRELLRQKVGATYRLIFKIEGHQFEIVDLIHRKDLEKWLSKERSNH